ncbi:MAG: PPC domain-containing DNA-binding protein [Alphaproteobacteria bacterium]
MTICFLIFCNLILISLVSLVILLAFKLGFLRYTKILKGKNWSAKTFGTKYVISLENSSEISETLKSFVVSAKIRVGLIGGLGAVNEATLRFFDPKTKKYVDKTFKGQMEISNLTGNISTKDGKEYLHLHITLGDENYQTISGHLLSAKLSGAGEFYAEKFIGSSVERSFSDEIGLNLYDFDK